MSKKSRSKSKQKRRQPPSHQLPWSWLAGGGVVLVLVAVLLVLQPWSGDDAPPVTPQVSGAPRLVVDQTTVDEGHIQYDVPIRTTFRLSNVGDQPLQVLGEPQVQLVQGC